MDPVVEYVEHVDVWAATIEDRSGALAHVPGRGAKSFPLLTGCLRVLTQPKEGE